MAVSTQLQSASHKLEINLLLSYGPHLDLSTSWTKHPSLVIGKFCLVLEKLFDTFPFHMQERVGMEGFFLAVIIYMP
ncbi:hypothetical protein LENED_011841 [Lentinula edodes]|uniref:Uncharacterized protein n=1 Tax=Lentinula edodes TaxID=5353 RepID=A0A1Q3ER38_LENED|nr:hypothetical protein LENED_011841 [Lentinula edodes]